MESLGANPGQVNNAEYGRPIPHDARTAEVEKFHRGKRQKRRGICLLVAGIWTMCGSLWPMANGHGFGIAIFTTGVILTIAGFTSYKKGQAHTSVSWERRVLSDMVRGYVSCQDCTHCYLKPIFLGWQGKSVAERQLLYVQGLLPHKRVCAHPETSTVVVSERFGLGPKYGSCSTINKGGRCPYFHPGSPMFFHFGDLPPPDGVFNKILYRLWRYRH